jgi:hypothetical protein
MRGIILLASTLALVADAVTAEAQSISPTLGVGVAVPLEHYARFRTAGPLLRAGLTLGGQQRRVRVRLDAEGAWLLDRTGGSGPGGSTEGTLRAIGALATVTMGPRGPVGLYVLLGLGPQWLQAAGAIGPNPYGAVPGVRAGLGVRARLARAEWHAEVALHGVLSDYATGHDFAAGSYLPVILGMRF